MRARTGDDDKERVRARLEELRRQAVSGADFSQLARDLSEDPATARQGGLWQVLDRDAIPAFLAPFVAGLGLGGVSEPFFLEDGGHVLKINDDYATLESLVREERVGARMKQLIIDFRSEIHVEERLADKWLWNSQAAAAEPAATDAGGRLP